MNGVPIRRLLIVVILGLLLVGVAVAPQLQARIFGKEYLVRVAPVDPIDPFRGAYVALTYPDLRQDSAGGEMHDGHRGEVFVSLAKRGEVWVATGYSRSRPSQGTYLACTDRSFQIKCGIESFFVPQSKAQALEASVQNGAIARLRIDGSGHAAIIGIE